MRAKGHCPKCGPEIWAEIESKFEHNGGDDETSRHDEHRILRCCGCDRVYFQTLTWLSRNDVHDGPDISHWPLPETRKTPLWLVQLGPKAYVLYRLAVETYAALNQDLGTLTAIGIRTIFDRSASSLEVDPELSFNEKLDELVKMGKIGADERSALAILTDAGSAAAHRAWRPTNEQLNTMMDAIEGFLHRSFIVSEDIHKMASEVPVRPKRR